MNRNCGALSRVVLFALAILLVRACRCRGRRAAELRETPMLAAQVAAGTLPPVAARVPLDAGRGRGYRVDRPPRRRIADADGEPEGHQDDGGLRLCPARRLYARSRIRPGYSRTGRCRGAAASSRCTCGPAINGPTASRSPRRISATGSRMSRGNKDLSPSGLPVVADAAWRAAPFRGARRADRALQLGAAEPAVPAGSGRSRARSTSIAPSHYLKQFHEKYADKETARRAGQGGRGRATGRRCTTKKTRCTGTTTRTCRRSNPGY